MIEEISLIQRNSTLFPGQQLEMVLTSIAEGNTSGRLWRVVGVDESTLYLLWDQGNNVFYLAGDNVMGRMLDRCVWRRRWDFHC